MLSRRCFLITATASAFAGALPRQAEARLVALPKPLPESAPLGSGNFTAAPAAWLRMLEHFPDLHPGREKLSRVISTEAREAELDHVQRWVNATTQFTLESRDAWRPAGQSGDCEDFALRKLDILMKRFNWPRNVLTLATCKAEAGQGHAVLLAHTSRGVYVLDNRRTHVLPWRALSYRWKAREEPGSPFELWREISVER